MFRTTRCHIKPFCVLYNFICVTEALWCVIDRRDNAIRSDILLALDGCRTVSVLGDVKDCCAAAERMRYAFTHLTLCLFSLCVHGTFPRTYSSQTFPFPDNSPPFLHAVGHPPSTTSPPPSANLQCKRSAVNHLWPH